MMAHSHIFLTFLLITAAGVNAAGYLLGLWHDETIFDEAVHFFTTFAITAAIGTALVRSGMLQATSRIYLVVPALGLLLGLSWEVIELIIGIIGGRTDTLFDLAMDLAGALAAAALVCWLVAKAQRVTQSSHGAAGPAT